MINIKKVITGISLIVTMFFPVSLSATSNKKLSAEEIVLKLYNSDIWLNPDEQSFDLFFHKDFERTWYIGNTQAIFNYDGTYDELEKLKDDIATLKFDITEVASDGDVVSLKYIVNTVRKADQNVLAKAPMMALWEVKDGKLYRCWESLLGDETYETSPLSK